ncbi:DegT/DnrJ/EryC1/StrS family aminotransferase [Mucilaginibacter sp. UYCu711]|uniref:DegT/DnrJ/EryC1/StrS family aminotransferase n=1 Tax=Mucilaginibacter sp. UYCu711 TaxID=3156339 RepID=UPI003D1D6137
MIPVFKPLLEKEEFDAAHNTLEIGWLGMGKFVNKFEEEVKKFLQCEDKYVVAVSTGHAALHLGLLIAGVGPGDEVITPSFNNISDFQAILATGASPVFCDIHTDTLCIDLAKAEELVNEKTKAIIVMDYDVFLCDHDEVAKFAKKHNIRVIHDAAHSFGSKYKGKMIGSFSDITMFSFDPVKTITCLDGGALVVNTEEEMIALHQMRLVGMGQPASVMYQNKRAWTYSVDRLGFRYHMSNMHAAIGLAQLSKIAKISETRRWACKYYNETLKDVQEVTTPNTDFKDITPFLYYIKVAADIRDEFREYLIDKGIDIGIHWQPGHWFKLFEDTKKGDLTVTDTIAKEILSLPLHSCMAEEDLEKITTEIKRFFNK